MPKKGRKAEDRAANYLESHGHHLVTRNYYCYRGEIDIITFDGDYVVFVEVKSRGSGSYVTPEESITPKKKRRLIRCAKRWLMENDYQGNARFDVIAISNGELSHYENAINKRSC
ncbi:YraN family protein [Candidatus Bipolaricaulota bacterium]|nr:YraN family protein [Candidatus Bipolaricaulota bacterium]